MPVFYIETSALFKRYHSEHGSGVVDELFDRPLPNDRLVTSYLSVLEVTGAMLRLAAGGQLTLAAAEAALARFRRAGSREVSLLPLDDSAITEALAVVEAHRLRAGDAIHLAAALHMVPLVAPYRVVLVSSDVELLQAAGAAGLVLLDPAGPDGLTGLRRLRT